MTIWGYQRRMRTKKSLSSKGCNGEIAVGQRTHKQQQFHENYHRTLRDIEERISKLPPEERYAGEYGVLRGFLGYILDTYAEAFTAEQLVEIRIILSSLDIVTGEKTQEQMREKQ